MTEFLLGLSLAAVAVTIQRMLLASRARSLRARELSFRFHEVRDGLQRFVIDGRLSSESRAYSMLMSGTNLAIKNCGAMKLKHLLNMALQVDAAVTRQTFKDIESQEDEVKELAGSFFEAFAQMLVNNDGVVRYSVRAIQAFEQSWHILKPTITLVDRLGARIVGILSPTRAQAVRTATRFIDNSRHLAAA